MTLASLLMNELTAHPVYRGLAVLLTVLILAVAMLSLRALQAVQSLGICIRKG